MTIDKSTTNKTRSIRLKVIKATWETLTIKEKLPDYLINSRKITSSSDVYQLFRYLGMEAKEHFLALHLDAKNKIICVDQVSVGSLTASIVHPREVMKSCMLSSCAGLVLVHNHPSEDPTPSREDIEITKRIKECCDLMGIRLLDHIVIGSDEYVSLADRGLI
jgi:DNA repair protein RadC